MSEATAAPATEGERETVDVREAAALLGVSRPTIYRHLDKLPARIRLGRRTFWFRRDLIAHLRQAAGA